MKKLLLVLGFMFITNLGYSALFPANTWYYTLQQDKVVKSTSSASEPINTYWYRGDFKVVNDTFTVNIDDITPYLILYGTGTIYAQRIEADTYEVGTLVNVSSQTAFTRMTLSEDLIVGTSLQVFTDSLYVDSSNVGIGDITPTYKLDVNGTFRTVGATQFDSTVGVTGLLTAGTNGLLCNGDASFQENVTVVEDLLCSIYYDKSGNKKRMLMTTSATDPTEFVYDVTFSSPTIFSREVTISSNVAMSGNFVLGAPGDEDRIQLNGYGNNVTITSPLGLGGVAADSGATINMSGELWVDGDVGIRNVSPSSTLDVTGTGDFSSSLEALELNLINGCTIAGSLNAGDIWVNKRIRGNSLDGLYLESSSGTTNVYISNDGSVGISTTAPVATLDVNGDINYNVTGVNRVHNTFGITTKTSGLTYFSNGSWANIDTTNFAVTLPTAGTYRIFGVLRGQHVGTTAALGKVRLYNNTDAAAVTNSDTMFIEINDTGQGLFNMAVNVEWIETFDSADTIYLQGYATAANVVGIQNDTNGYSRFGYIRLY